MLNMDGVIEGNNRCSLAGTCQICTPIDMKGFDLNREWNSPTKEMHPTIYHTKQLLKLLPSCGKPSKIAMYIDLHGHARKKVILSLSSFFMPTEYFCLWLSK